MIRSKIFTSLFAVAALSCLNNVMAESPVVVTINVNLAAEQYYKVKDFIAELGVSQEQAKSKVDSMREEGESMIKEFEELVEQAKSDILTEDARKEAQTDALKKQEEIQSKENEIRQFVANTQRSIQAREQTQMSLFFKEIREVILEIAKERQASLVFDLAGTSSNGLPSVLYADDSYEITDEVVKRINATQEEGSGE